MVIYVGRHTILCVVSVFCYWIIGTPIERAALIVWRTRAKKTMVMWWPSSWCMYTIQSRCCRTRGKFTLRTHYNNQNLRNHLLSVALCIPQRTPRAIACTQGKHKHYYCLKRRRWLHAKCDACVCV